jgi:hypothetical protein
VKEAAAEAGIDELFVFGSAEGATPFDSLLAETDHLFRTSRSIRKKILLRFLTQVERQDFQRRDADASQPRFESQAD